MPVAPFCPGINCRLIGSCKRYHPNIDTMNDIYFAHTPYNHRKKECEFFIGIDNEELRERIKKILDAPQDPKQI